MKKNFKNKTIKIIQIYFDKLFQINRSIMGAGYRKTLKILAEIMPTKKIKFKSGKKVLDWKIPLEWSINDAFILTPNKKKICQFKKNNLHIVNYSEPVNKILNLKSLKKKLHFVKALPDAIPYITSYYKKRWGFCIKYKDYKKLKDGNYHVFINSNFKKGELIVGEKILKGKSKNEILFSSYICHPSMANNELSGPLVLINLYNMLKRKKLFHTIRFVLSAETIGTIAYLSKRGTQLKKNVIAGYQMTCLGDRGNFTYKETKNGNTITDAAAKLVLKKYGSNRILKFFPTGSDERQYSSPGFNLPIGSLMRTPYDRYKEYHTSLDNRSFISFIKIYDSIKAYLDIVTLLENNFYILSLFPYGEPQLNKRDLYKNLSNYNFLNSKLDGFNNSIFWILSHADGKTSYLEILQKSNLEKKDFDYALKILINKKMVKKLMLNEKKYL